MYTIRGSKDQKRIQKHWEDITFMWSAYFYIYFGSFPSDANIKTPIFPFYLLNCCIPIQHPSLISFVGPRTMAKMLQKMTTSQSHKHIAPYILVMLEFE